MRGPRDRVRSAMVAMEVLDERGRQWEKHGAQWHLPDGTGAGRDLARDLRACVTHEDLAHQAKARCQAASRQGKVTFEHVLTEEWAEALAESDPAKLRAELVQVAAVAVQWIEKLDREK